jgi:uncharacterized membrane protein
MRYAESNDDKTLFLKDSVENTRHLSTIRKVKMHWLISPFVYATLGISGDAVLQQGRSDHRPALPLSAGIGSLASTMAACRQSHPWPMR